MEQQGHRRQPLRHGSITGGRAVLEKSGMISIARTETYGAGIRA
jgi:hypothetical protein